jgi:hypothetical protein
LLSKETDVASYTAAIANGSIGLEEGQKAISMLNQRYEHIIQLYYKEKTND